MTEHHLRDPPETLEDILIYIGRTQKRLPTQHLDDERTQRVGARYLHNLVHKGCCSRPISHNELVKRLIGVGLIKTPAQGAKVIDTIVGVTIPLTYGRGYKYEAPKRYMISKGGTKEMPTYRVHEVLG